MKLEDAASIADQAVTCAQELGDLLVRFVDDSPGRDSATKGKLGSELIVSFAKFWVTGRALLVAAADALESSNGLEFHADAADGWDF